MAPYDIKKFKSLYKHAVAEKKVSFNLIDDAESSWYI
jgi:hypothetical protein